VANILAVQTPAATLHLTLKNNAAFGGEVIGDLPVEQSAALPGVRSVNLGPLQYGQSREVVVPVAIPAGAIPYLEATVTATDPVSGEQIVHAKAAATARAPSAAGGPDGEEEGHELLALLRGRAVSVGAACLVEAERGNGQQACAMMASLVDAFPADDECSSELMALKGDVSGRMSKALKGQQRFNRWGKHYLRAVVRAHQLQLCTNFMVRIPPARVCVDPSSSSGF